MPRFSSEPPDQALCVSEDFILEAVNTAVRALDHDGTPIGEAIPLNQFFQLAPSIDRAQVLFGDFTSDPKCYYDPEVKRWFLTVLQADVDPPTGAFLGPTSVLLAVSQSKDPTGSWSLYKLDTTNGDGTLEGHPGCPCLGDQPLIGADENGFYISTNEFSFFGPEFNGAQIYAISKRKLVMGVPTRVVHIQELDAAGFPAFSVQPATSPGARDFEEDEDGTEYFLSSVDFEGTFADRIAVWALTDTETLKRGRPDVRLLKKEIRSQVYGQPEAAEQMEGPRLLGGLAGEPLPRLESND